MKLHMVDLKSQYTNIKADVDAAIAEVLSSTQFIGGKKVSEFSDNLATYLDCKYVIPCGNGTDALQIALMALDLEPGDEIITTPFTFVSTAEVIALLKLKPVFVDINPNTFNLDETKLEAAITSQTRCIIPVHLFGQPCDMSAIMDIAEKHNLFVVEDNAQAIGSKYQLNNDEKKMSGAIGHIGCTSFFPSKNLGAYGDAGALMTNNERLYNKIKLICNHGSSVRYYHESIGVNSRLDGIQAAILDIKLKKLDSYNKARQEAAVVYNKLLEGNNQIITPKIQANSTHVFHQYTIRIKAKRDQVAAYFKEHNIPFGIYYPVPLHLQEAYLDDEVTPQKLPISEQASAEVFSLPMHTELTIEQQTYIIDHLNKALS